MKKSMLDIDNLIDILNKYELTEIKYSEDKFKVKIKKEQQERESIEDIQLVQEIKSNMDEEIKNIFSTGIGRYFYQDIIAVGDRIKVGQEIGYILTMGVKNPIKATTTGEIIEILIENGSNVDYGKALLKVKTGRN